MLPFKNSKNDRPYTLGIDIGPSAVKAVAIRQDENALTVTHALAVPTPPECLEKSVVTGIPQLGRAIKQIVKKMGVPCSSAAVAVPAEHTLVFWIDLPVMDDRELRAATPFEARKYLSIPVDQSELQIIVDRNTIAPGAATMKALLVAAPRDVVRSRAEALEAAGIQLACLELEAFALMRTMRPPELRQQSRRNNNACAYLQLGDDQSSMSVLQGGLLKFVRSVSWGGYRLAEALAEGLRISADDARKIIERPSAAVTEQGLLLYDSNETASAYSTTDALVDELERLTRETRRLMNYYKSLFPEGSYEGILSEITLCGGPANMSGLGPYLTSRLGIDCEAGDPFAARTLKVDPEVRTVVGRGKSSYAVAVGLALGEMEQLARVSAGDLDLEYVWRRPITAAPLRV